MTALEAQGGVSWGQCWGPLGTGAGHVFLCIGHPSTILAVTSTHPLPCFPPDRVQAGMLVLGGPQASQSDTIWV